MQVIKRDGTLEEFNSDKIYTAILNALKATTKHEIPKRTLTEIRKFSHTFGYSKEDLSVEFIQDSIEKWLMTKGWFNTARAYILYREEHKKARLIRDKIKYIHNYSSSNKSATNLSNTDDNANSSQKNVASLESEVYKDINRIIQRNEMKSLLAEINSPYKDDYIRDVEHHIIYPHDEASSPVKKPYCSAYTLYTLLVDGTTNVDGTRNHAPRHLSSFCGQFQNLVFLLSAQKKGAGAYGEFFNFFDYFCRKEWGDQYYTKEDVIITNEHCLERRTIGQTIDQYFQSITHYINQPAQNRGYQSPFTNFNVFDRYYWHSLFDDFVFPDGSRPIWESVSWLQRRYMKWLNKERTQTLLTFPVMTVCLLTEDNDVKDKEYKDFVTTQWTEGDSFFVYLSDNADSVSSCCRLRNEITDNTFSSTTGMTGVQTGSCNVITLNLNRIIQDWARMMGVTDKENAPVLYKEMMKGTSFEDYLKSILDRVYEYQRAYKTGLYQLSEKGMLPQTKAGYISLDRLYCTIGVNGHNEAARFLGMKVSDNKEYMDFVTFLFSTINEYNKQNSSKKFMFNLEIVPAESLGVKNYNWDKEDGYWVPEDKNLYNSYVYDVHDDTSILEKIRMQGGKVAKSISGGQAAHLNLQENLSKEQYTKLLEYAVKVGNNYITFNVPQTQCDSCSFIAKYPFDKCPKCGSTHVTQWSRVIGYLRPVKTWSDSRQEEWKHRYFANSNNLDGNENPNM